MLINYLFKEYNDADFGSFCNLEVFFIKVKAYYEHFFQLFETSFIIVWLIVKIDSTFIKLIFYFYLKLFFSLFFIFKSVIFLVV